MSKKLRGAFLATTLSAVAGMLVTAAPSWAGEPVHVKGELKHWVVEGSLTAKTSNQTVTLPEGSEINLKDEIEIETEPDRTEGTISGVVTVPPFKHTLTIPILGLPTPVNVGVTFTEVGQAVLKIVEAPGHCAGQNFPAGCVSLSGPTNVVVGFDVVGILGLEVPTHCETSKPIVFNLKDNITLFEMLVTGPHFSGTTTIPPIKCQGLEGLVLGTAMTATLSGQGNPWALFIHRPLPPPEG